MDPDLASSSYPSPQVKDIKWLLFAFATVLFFIAAGSLENGADWLMQVWGGSGCGPCRCGHAGGSGGGQKTDNVQTIMYRPLPLFSHPTS